MKIGCIGWWESSSVIATTRTSPLDSRLRRPLNYSELAIRERFLDLKCGMWGLNQACRALSESYRSGRMLLHAPLGDAPTICFHRVVELSRRIMPT